MIEKLESMHETLSNVNTKLSKTERFRPYSVQKEVVAGLTALAHSDSEVMKGINTPHGALPGS